MPSFWDTSPSSSNYASQDFTDQFSPTSSSSSLFKRNAATKGQLTDSCDSKRRNSQARIMDALMSPRHFLSPSSSTIIQPSDFSNTVGGKDKRSTPRYIPRQISLDSSHNPNFNNSSSNDHRNIQLNRTPSYEMTIESFECNLPQELNYVTLRRPRKTMDRIKVETKDVDNEKTKQSSSLSIEGSKNPFPLKKQKSGSSSSSTIGNLAENDIPARSGLEYSILKDKRNTERPNTALVKNGSSHSSLCSTLEETDENY